MIPISVIYTLLVPALLVAIWSFRFLQLHLFHRGRLPRYLAGSAKTEANHTNAWSLVTGASDGIGFGFVQELADRGFSVILHGRNETKLGSLLEKMQTKYPTRSFRVFVLDASDRERWPVAFKHLLAELQEHNIDLRVLVNNVGGTGGSFNAFDRITEQDLKTIRRTIDVNAAFPAAITHALLPVLMVNQPSLIINIGSVAALIAPPYLGLYSGSKAFNLAWNESLWTEMLAEKQDIEVMGIIVVRVVNAARSAKVSASLFEPSARAFAKATLDKVGYGESAIIPYWPHHVQVALLKLLPVWSVRGIMIAESKKEMERERQGR